ncbi:hypothetical protein ACMGE6_08035 [Macrococcus equi]|uniref:hypothetical protein n=1 Tax=Macrococcus equi TaxID=3395462 RepID=UPI0039BE4D32
MKKLALVLSTSILLVACGSNDKHSEKGSSQIVNESKQSSTPVKKVKSDNFDISSKSFVEEFTKDKGKGFRGIEPGMTYADVKKRLGKPTQYSIEEMPDFGGFRFYFNNFILVFEGVKKKSDIKEDSRVKYVFIQNKEATPVEKFDKAWGPYSEFNPFNHGSIGSNTYEINGTTYYGFFSHGIIEFVSKENMVKIFVESQGKTYKDDGDKSITEVNGVSHYNVPDLLSKSFADSIKENTFNIDGFGLLKSTNKDPYNDLKPIEAESGEGLAVYDNFILHLKSGTGKTPNYPVNQIDILDLSSQNVTIDELLEKWNISSDKLAFHGGSFQIFNLDNGTYITFKYDIDSKIIDEINLNEGTFSEGAPPSDIEDTDSTDDSNEAQINDPNIDFRNGTSYYNFPDITNFDFAYQVCTAAFKINGIGLGDTPDLEPLGEYHENEVIYEYGNFGFEMIGDRVNGIKLHVADQNVQIDTLEKAWKSRVDIRKKNSIFYDNDKTNGFLVRVDFDDDGVVQDIFILGVII